MEYNLETVGAIREALRDLVDVFATDGKTTAYVTSMLKDGRFLAYSVWDGMPAYFEGEVRFYAAV